MNQKSGKQSDNTERLRRAFVALESMQQRLHAAESKKTEPIAIIGIGCRFPGGANDPAAYWQLLAEGGDAICEVPKTRWDVEHFYDPDSTKQGKINTRNGGFLNTNVYDFDPQFFGLSPKETLQLDPQQRLLLEVAWEALEYANIVPDQLFGSTTGVFVGISSFDYAVRQLGLQPPSEIGAYVGTGALLSPAAGRLSYVLGLTGPSTVVDTACSSSLLAVHLACQSLRNQESDLVLSAGVNLMLAPELSSYFSTAGMLSSDGHCKTFDASANGYVRGEGCGVIVLKRLSDALADGNNVLAIVRGSAINQDGPSGGLTVPSGPSQEKVILQAQARSGVEPNQVDYIEAHGTGTALGDPIEVGALGSVFGKNRPAEKPLLIGSAKTNIGHMEAAAGMGGLIKVVLALQNEEIPPHLHFKQPSPRIPWSSFPVKVPTQRTPWRSTLEQSRIAGVSSFGFSGTNAHVIVEQAPSPLIKPIASGKDNRSHHCLTLSAKSAAALDDLTKRYRDYFKNNVVNGTTNLADICFTANTSRSRFQHRLSIVAQSSPQMAEKLTQLALQQDLPGVVIGVEQTSLDIAFLFTGQGSQYVDMGKALYASSTIFRASLDRCNNILTAWLEKPLLDVMFNVTESENPLLNQTNYTQPALFALEYALFQLWQSWGITPTVVLGHSVGEYVAACVAGVFSLEDGLQLIAKRAQLMHHLPGDGAMITVFSDCATVTAALQPYTEQVAIAAINGPENIVISGQAQTLNTLSQHFAAAAITTKQLNVSHAFHSPLMETMLAEFATVLKQVKFSPPAITVISNLTGEPATAEITSIDYWLRHIRQPVQFASGMQSLNQQGCGFFVEIGPRPALIAMGRQCIETGDGVWLPSLRHGKNDWQQILESLGSLYVHGAEVNWSKVDADYQRRGVILPTYPFQRKRYSIERPTATGAVMPVTARPHPLLDRQLRSPLLTQTLYESWFHVDALPLLADHLVYEQVLVSGACHVALILGATEMMFATQGCVLGDIFFQQALVVPENGCQVQLAINNKDENDHVFKLISLAQDSDDWITHVSGRVQNVKLAPPDVIKAQDIWARCPNTLAANEFYQMQLRRHIYLGPRYQWIKSVSRGNNEAICQIECPQIVTDADQYQLFPGLIDACFGLLAVAMDVDLDIENTFIPFAIEKVKFFQRPREKPLQAYVKLREQPDDGKLIGDIQLFETSGSVIAEFTGFEGRKTARDNLLPAMQIDSGRSTLNDWFYRVDWQSQTLSKSINDNQADSGYWLLFVDTVGVGAALAEQLRQRDQSVILISVGDGYCKNNSSSYTVNPVAISDFQQLFTDLGTLQIDKIVHLWSLDANIENLSRSQELTCASVLHLLQSITVKTSALFPSLYLVSDGGQSVLDGDVQVQKSLIWGLGRVINLEYPELACVCLDLDHQAGFAIANSALILINELQTDHGRETQIAWREEQRFVARLQRHKLIAKDIPIAISKHNSYLITGGTGALGVLLARWLVDQGVHHVILLSRSGAVKQEQQAILKEIEHLGADLVIIQADVANQTGLNQALTKQLTDMPALKGVIHVAGVLDDGMLMTQTWQQFEHVLAAKVAGAWNLHQYTAAMQLDFFVMFSSITSILGNQGQGNYASANAFLDALAHFRRQHNLVANTINWGPWQQAAGMASLTKIEDRLAKQGFRLFKTQAGLDVLTEVLSADNATQVTAVQCDWQEYLAHMTAPPFFDELSDTRTTSNDAKSSSILTMIESSKPHERHKLLLDFVALTAKQVIGLEESEPLDFAKHLAATGMDSLMSVEIRNRLSKALGASLPVSLLFNYPTVHEITDYLEQEVIAVTLVTDNTTIPEEPAKDSEEYDFLDELSEAELEGLINQSIVENE